MMPALRHEDVTSPGLERWPRGGKRRAAVRLRRWVGRALLVTPGLAVVAVDLVLRRERIVHADPDEIGAYVAACLLCIALWSAIISASCGRTGTLRWLARALLGTVGLCAVGGQLYAFHRYRAFLDTGSMLVGTAILPSIGEQLWFDRWSFLRATLPPVFFLGVVAFLYRKLTTPRRSTTRRAGDALVVLLAITAFCPPQRPHGDLAPFDVLYMTSVGQLGRALWDHNPCVARRHPGPRSPLPVPPLVANPPAPRNVLFIITESVRAMDVCVSYDRDCRATPFSNALTPHRIGLEQMRSLDSTTAISLAVLWSGLGVESPRAALHSAPLAWEYASAAGFDTAYWTSQNLLFGNSGGWLASVPWKHHVSATELEPDATMETGASDADLVSYVDDRLGDLHEPFLAVVHLSNTHMPYVIDEDDAPYLPARLRTGQGHEVELANRYKDAIYLQDRAVARLIAAERARPEGARTVIVFISDHGEQLYEKGGVGHTGTLFDPEIRVPAWIDAPDGTLAASERESLVRLRTTPLTEVDVLPTLLDLMGIDDDPKLAPFAASFAGRSLLRGGSAADHPVVLTNCSELWACAFKNWGAIQGSRKLVGTESDHAWSCFDVLDDPEEMHDLGAAGCGSLDRFAEASLHGMPF